MTHEHIQTLCDRKDLFTGFESGEITTWCSGCGNYAIQNALRQALTLENITAREVLFCYDIGCHGNGADKTEGYSIHGLHGRVIPLAAGAALANTTLKVIAEAGDGGTMSEGVNHLIHAVRSNYPMMFIMHDNQNYALTTGQASATSCPGQKYNAAPEGVSLSPINAMQLVLAANPSFVARTISADVDHMRDVFQQALRHPGFAFIEVLQACPTYTPDMTNEWLTTNTRDVSEIADYDTENINHARHAALEKTPIPIGVLYRDHLRDTYAETLPARDDYSTPLTTEVREHDIREFLDIIA